MENPLLTLLQQYLSETAVTASPQTLYEPANYILSLGGKRIRPLLCLVACAMFDKNPAQALPAAAAVEWFHNFSLIHDDIMDKADTRRGQATVHQRYGLNTAILSGDMMLVKAYQFLEPYPPLQLAQLLKIFSQTALEVCEGQQYDMDFETAYSVSMPEYIQMISLKTAVLLAASLKMGAIIADAPSSDVHNLYEFGRNIGIAFQLQDDILDTFGKEQQTGKRVGGDILNNKKTCLLIAAIAAANEPTLQIMQTWMQNNDPEYADEKIKIFTTIFEQLGAYQTTQTLLQYYYDQAFAHLNELQVLPEKKQLLQQITQKLMVRMN